MKALSLNKLDWQDLLASLSKHCQTEEARQRVLNLEPNLTKEEILKSWEWTESLCQLINLGYCPKVGALTPIDPLLKGVLLGRILDGSELLVILKVLQTTERLSLFLKDLSSKAIAFSEIQQEITPCTKLFSLLDHSLDDEGELKDTASKNLQKIRSSMKSLSSKIENQLKEFFHGHDKDAQYLQDQYFTKRLGRYVLPIRIDGRGRVQGAIIDTSVSAQTIFVEPSGIKSFNDQLIELSQLEKIEQMKIFKQLSIGVRDNEEVLRKNYEALVTIDYITASALFALKIKAGKVQLRDKPGLSLLKAHHPLIYLKEGKGSIPNDILLGDGQRTLIISGPNAGGKSIVLKTLGLLQVMAKSGLLIPCDERSELYLFKDLHVELGDAQSLTDSFSSFSGHLNNLKPILATAGESDLILLDEIATGTEPQTGSAIAEAIIESLHKRNCFTIVTTHFDGLKQIAARDVSYRNGSMEYSPGGAKATYKLLLDIPGQSYGIELAEKVGLDKVLIERAKEIRGNKDSSVELLLTELSHKRDELRVKEQSLKEKTTKAEELSSSVAKELKSLKEKKGESIRNLVTYYDKKLERMYEDFYVLESQFKKLLKLAREKSPVKTHEEIEKLSSLKNKTENQIALLNKSILSIGSEKSEKKESLPGIAFTLDKARQGDEVYVIDLKKKGSLVDVIDPNQKKIEVAIGPIRVSVEASDLRYLSSGAPKKDSQKKKMKSFFRDKSERKSRTPEFQTTTNTLDLRGLRIDEALSSMWSFVDKALLRGDSCVYLIHGHGMDALKQGVRGALKEDSPYSISYKAAGQKEGGDGVTIVSFEAS